MMANTKQNHSANNKITTHRHGRFRARSLQYPGCADRGWQLDRQRVIIKLMHRRLLRDRRQQRVEVWVVAVSVSANPPHPTGPGVPQHAGVNACSAAAPGPRTHRNPSSSTSQQPTPAGIGSPPPPTLGRRCYSCKAVASCTSACHT